MSSRLAGVLVATLAACRPSVETIPYTTDMLASIEIFDGLQSWRSNEEIRIKWPSGRVPPAAGTRFVAVDRDGFVAILETTGAIEDSALHTHALTDLRRCHNCAVAGPTRAALPRARVVNHRRPLTWFIHPGDPEWVVDRTVDLDGDGRVDLEYRRRCAHTMHSGCSDRVCNRICFAIRGRAEYCQDADPEIDDCGDD
jgi:hypothetical protein